MKVDEHKKTVTLSSIFDWFGSNFTNYIKPQKSDATVIDFIALYLASNSTEYDWLSENSNAKITYFDYDWNLNTVGSAPCGTSDRTCYQLWALLVTLGALLLVTIVIVIVGICIKRRQNNRSGYWPIQSD